MECKLYNMAVQYLEFIIRNDRCSEKVINEEQRRLMKKIYMALNEEICYNALMQLTPTISSMIGCLSWRWTL